MRLAQRCFAAFLILLLPVLPDNTFAQVATPTPVPGTVEVSFKDYEGKYLTRLARLELEVYKVRRDANGEYVKDSSRPLTTLEARLSGPGIASVSIPPGYYILEWVCCYPSRIYFLEDDIGVFEVRSGEKVAFHRTLARIDYVAREENGSFLPGEVGLFKAKKDPNGQIVEPARNPRYNGTSEMSMYLGGPFVFTTTVDSLGTIDVLPGVYTLAQRAYPYPGATVEWEYQEITLEPGMRYLKGNLPDWSTRATLGRYFTQTGQNQGGYNVTDQDGMAFWSEFQRLGGVGVLGYPTSARFSHNGKVVQAFQRALLEWNPGLGTAEFFDNLREIVALKGESWLTSQGVPERLGIESEEEAYALLELNPSIRDFYYALPNYLEMLGLPEGYGENAEQVLIRTRKGVLQYWLVPKPWAKVGEVTFMNVGDLAKDAEIVPASSAHPTTAL